jgi:predicted transcriptional regulator
VTKKKLSESKLLTETELELMNILWKLGEGAVSDVIEHLPQGRELAYTSVSTILRILEQKKVVGSRKAGRGHIYYPLVKKDDYEATSLHHLVSKVFDGDPSTLVRRLIESKDLNESELAEIRQLLNQRLEK